MNFLLATLLLATSTQAFVVAPGSPKTVGVSLKSSVEQEIDYDAPIDRMLNAGHEVAQSPTYQYTIGLGKFGTVCIPDFSTPHFITHAFDPDQDGLESHKVKYTLGLGDIGTLNVDGTFCLDCSDKMSKDSYTIGLGDQGTIYFPSFLGKLFDENQAFTLGLGDLGTLTLRDALGSSDDCYLGIDGDAAECVDFDPMHGGLAP